MSSFCSSRYIAFSNSITDCTSTNIFNGLNIRDDYWRKWNGILRSKNMCCKQMKRLAQAFVNLSSLWHLILLYIGFIYVYYYY